MPHSFAPSLLMLHYVTLSASITAFSEGSARSGSVTSQTSVLLLFLCCSLQPTLPDTYSPKLARQASTLRPSHWLFPLPRYFPLNICMIQSQISLKALLKRCLLARPASTTLFEAATHYPLPYCSELWFALTLLYFPLPQ